MFVQGDLHEPALVAALGSFDVVWCTGVIYHTPNPYLQVEHLRALTRETLLLGSQIVPEIPGVPNACLWYPGMPEHVRDGFARAFGERAGDMVGMATPFDATPRMGYVNFWWGITPSALRSMLTPARLRLVDEWRYSPFLMDVLAEPLPGESVIPAVELSRERGQARAAAPV